MFGDTCLGGRTIKKSKEIIFINVSIVITSVRGGSDWERQEGTFSATGSNLFLDISGDYMDVVL